MCQRRAAWRINDGPGFEDYTLACDRHVGALRSATTTHADVIPEEFPCCYAGTDGMTDDAGDRGDDRVVGWG